MKKETSENNKKVYDLIFSEENKHNDHYFLSYAKIVKKSDISETMVSGIIRSLQQEGFMIKTNFSNRTGGAGTNGYQKTEISPVFEKELPKFKNKNQTKLRMKKW